jgi:beta-glucanase (GH16 family)
MAVGLMPGVIRWYVDGALYATRTEWSSITMINGQPRQNPWPAPFDKPFYIVMNLAVGGNFAGDPDAQTVFPAEIVVDYVRVYDDI